MPVMRKNGMTKNHAILHTATIDVKIMRLDGKQVTLSVFRQLDEETVFNADGTLRGVIWGRVNYTWGKTDDGVAYHVVWQDGEYLKRSPIPKLDPKEICHHDPEEQDAWLDRWANPTGKPISDGLGGWDGYLRECGDRIDSVGDLMQKVSSSRLSRYDCPEDVAVNGGDWGGILGIDIDHQQYPWLSKWGDQGCTCWNDVLGSADAKTKEEFLAECANYKRWLEEDIYKHLEEQKTADDQAYDEWILQLGKSYAAVVAHVQSCAFLDQLFIAI